VLTPSKEFSMNVPSMNESSRDAHPASGRSNQAVALVLSWTAVGIPLAWGVAETLRKALALFQ
jgi:hypothetical protein